MSTGCTGDTICVIPEGQSNGSCESQVTLKWAAEDTSSPVDVSATVRKVGSKVAVLVDDANNANVKDSDVEALVTRFDSHIAPLDHQLFGEPAGKDRDKNGVVIVFLTSRVANISANLAGFFFADDMRATSEAPHSNAADILYMQPPSTTVSLDSLSGTIAHEYQHLLNFSSKVIVHKNSTQEAAWLDEGLAGFSEDALGYGKDAFGNVAAYLQKVPLTSLTGFGLEYTSEFDADSAERRGMVHLMIRYLFEQGGGASFGGAGEATDKGGIAKVRGIVSAAGIGFDALATAHQGRTFNQLLGDFLTTVGLDGTDLDCLAGFAAPEESSFTGFQRGIDLRKSITVPGGSSIPLNGPDTASFETEEDVPFPINGGEFRTVTVAADGSVLITVKGPAADVDVAFRAVGMD